ncbi:MAG: Endolytic peptidoglycan transglycosylase RlpA [Syntrophus sp. SKADARSKE-3]|nr:Endolytic peptidoglycan transglycosylase RlpA [Syntrophus sp. SKADARSKE-3]
MILRKPMIRWIWLFLACLSIFVFTAIPIMADEPPKAADEKSEQLSDDQDTYQNIKGLAVYYGKRYQGRRTHSGAVYRHKKPTAAHPTLPMGSKVKVVNLANNRSVVVTVNDRCRKRSVEFIDLSRSAAQKLGFLGKGYAKVQMSLIEDES